MLSVFQSLNSIESETICRSSISERLSKIDSDFFKQIYECIYEQFSRAYSSTAKRKYNLIRVDSSMVSEASSKLQEEGIDHKNGKMSVKYSIAFDGVLPSEVKVFTHLKYASKYIALPEVVHSHVKQEKGHQNIYVIDRGLQSTRTLRDLSKESIAFIVRAKEQRNHIELESFIKETTDRDLGDLTLVKDVKVYLYTGIPLIT